jgi:hypothetical protein
VTLRQHFVLSVSDAWLVRVSLAMKWRKPDKENSLEDRNTAPRDRAEVLEHRGYIPD